jgi:hypothetical protein
MSYLTHADRSVGHAFEKVGFNLKTMAASTACATYSTSSVWPEAPGRFPAKTLVTLQPDRVVNFSGICNGAVTTSNHTSATYT